MIGTTPKNVVVLVNVAYLCVFLLEYTSTEVTSGRFLKTTGRTSLSCCDAAKSMSVEEIFRKTNKCSKFTTIKWMTCNCESLIACKFAVVSAISDNHFEEALDFIASVQAYMPYSPIIVYNLGLKSSNREALLSYCNVRVREFKFDRYPRHVLNLLTYAWKPIIINEIYQEGNFEVILWGDASCRLLRSLTPLFTRFSYFPIIPGIPEGHFFISTTHDGMMKYLNLSKTRIEYASIGNSLQANIIMFWHNSDLQEIFLKFWVDCALHEECIAPKGASKRNCNWKNMQIGKYACHRYDQAAYNAILVREFGLEFMKQMARNDASLYFQLKRHPTNDFEVHTRGNCSQSHQ